MFKLNAARAHQIGVSANDFLARFLRPDSFSGNLFDFVAFGNRSARSRVSLGYSHGYRVSGMAFANACVSEYFVLFLFGINARNGEFARRQRSRFIEKDNVCFVQLLDIVRAFDKNPLAARAAYSAEKSERNTDNQRARTTDDEEGESPFNPFAPERPRKSVVETYRERRYHGKSDRREHHERRVIFCERRNEVFRFRLFARSIFHHVENFRGGAVVKLLGNPYLEVAVESDRSAENFVARPNERRRAFARQSAGVKVSVSADDHAVKRNFLAGNNEHAFAHGNFFGINLHLFAVPFNARLVRSDIHQRRYRLPRFADGVTLEKFAHLIEQNNGDAFRKIARPFGNAERERAERRYRHKKILVENFSVSDISRRFK